jgi:predicted metal-dependent peptidase
MENTNTITSVFDFRKEFPKRYSDILEDVMSYSARLTRVSELTIGIVLSNFEIQLTTDVTNTICIGTLNKGANNFVLYININYWLTLEDSFDNKLSALKERLISFLLLHFIHAKEKNQYIWNICSKLEAIQYMSDFEIDCLNQFTLEDIEAIVGISLPNDCTANKYYNLIAPKESILELNSKVSSVVNDVLFLIDGTSSSTINSNTSNLLNEVASVMEGLDTSFDKSWGTMSMAIKNSLSALVITKPKKNYNKMLRNIAGRLRGGYALSYKRPHRYKDTISKTKTASNTKPHVLIAIDVSASVSNAEVLETLNEICSIREGSITVIQFDTEIVSKDTYTKREFKNLIKKGYTLNARGGTSFKEVIDEFSDNYITKSRNGYSFLIVFTDGCANSALPQTKGKVDRHIASRIRWLLSSSGTDRYLNTDYQTTQIIRINE